MSGESWRAVWDRLPDEVRAQLCRMIERDPTVPSVALVIDCEVHPVEELALGEIMVWIKLTSPPRSPYDCFRPRLQPLEQACPRKARLLAGTAATLLAMQARTELEALELEVGAAVVMLKTRYPHLTWTRIGEAVGVKRTDAKELAVRYLLQSATDGGRDAGIVRNTNTLPRRR